MCLALCFKASGSLCLVKVLDKGQWRDALQAEKQEGISGASLGSEGNTIIPQPHPAGVKTHGHLSKNESTSENRKILHLDYGLLGKNL